MSFADRLRKLVKKLFPQKTTIESKLQVQIATSTTMENEIEVWREMYINAPPWAGGDYHIRSLNLPAAISEEFARLILSEFEFKLEGNPRADYIAEQMENLIDNLSNIVEVWAALGGIALKPYVTDSDGNGQLDKIGVDVIYANQFYPTAYNSNKEITGAIFTESKRIGDYLYTRLEYHKLEGRTYTVTNRAFRSEKQVEHTTDDAEFSVSDPFKDEVSLASVDGWAGLEPEVVLEGVDHPLFVYVKVPRANNVDPQSPIGASVYSRSRSTLEEADKQFSRILWEYEATEAAIDVDESLLDSDINGNPILPEGKHRLFRTYASNGSADSQFITPYNPTIRDQSLFNGLNEFVRKIEFQCGLAYGTLSDPSDVEKTATEIRASKQRSYATVSAMQKAWDGALDDIIRAMDIYCTLYNLAPAGELEKTCTWGDSVLEDTDAEYQRRWAMVTAGKLRPEKFMAWYFGCSEEDALAMIPDSGFNFPELE